MEQIKSNVAQLDWKKDPLLAQYGMEIDTAMIKVCSHFTRISRNRYSNLALV